MAITETNKVDFIGIDKDTNDVVLTISDHLNWSDDNHLLLLQGKINTYISFVESGELYSQEKNYSGKDIRIDVVTRYEPTEEAKSFLDKVEIILKEMGIGITYRKVND